MKASKARTENKTHYVYTAGCKCQKCAACQAEKALNKAVERLERLGDQYRMDINRPKGQDDMPTVDSGKPTSRPPMGINAASALWEFQEFIQGASSDEPGWLRRSTASVQGVWEGKVQGAVGEATDRLLRGDRLTNIQEEWVGKLSDACPDELRPTTTSDDAHRPWVFLQAHVVDFMSYSDIARENGMHHEEVRRIVADAAKRLRECAEKNNN